MFEEIERCAAVLERQTGSIGKWFRPSQTDVPDAAILDQAGRVGYATSVGYDIDPLDYTDPGASLVESRVRARLHPGAIVSLPPCTRAPPRRSGRSSRRSEPTASSRLQSRPCSVDEVTRNVAP
jgi:peptidoglycan/xylan/chitin deacetylase (PgdA/CDA1 family)